MGYAAKELNKIMVFLIACPYYFTRLSLSLCTVYVDYRFFYNHVFVLL
jgi:hypothetical protein